MVTILTSEKPFHTYPKDFGHLIGIRNTDTTPAHNAVNDGSLYAFANQDMSTTKFLW